MKKILITFAILFIIVVASGCGNKEVNRIREKFESPDVIITESKAETLYEVIEETKESETEVETIKETETVVETEVETETESETETEYETLSTNDYDFTESEFKVLSSFAWMLNEDMDNMKILPVECINQATYEDGSFELFTVFSDDNPEIENVDVTFVVNPTITYIKSVTIKTRYDSYDACANTRFVSSFTFFPQEKYFQVVVMPDGYMNDGELVLEYRDDIMSQNYIELGDKFYKYMEILTQ